jgi:hypothetical protein
MTEPLIRRYFELAAQQDTDEYFAQFAADATVIDDGHRHDGIDAIRTWRREVPLVTYTPHDIVATQAKADIAGDLPGSPVQLSFEFGFDARDRITSLTIAP